MSKSKLFQNTVEDKNTESNRYKQLKTVTVEAFSVIYAVLVIKY